VGHIYLGLLSLLIRVPVFGLVVQSDVSISKLSRDDSRCSSTRIFWIAFSCRNVWHSGELDMWEPEQFIHRIGPEQMVSPWSFIPHFRQMMSEVHRVCVCPNFWHLKQRIGFGR
jgi:hypothetical protein